MSQSRRSQNPRKSHLPEYTTEAAVIGVSLGLYGFIKLTEEVVNGDTRGFDRDILLMFRNPGQMSDPVGPPWL